MGAGGWQGLEALIFFLTVLAAYTGWLVTPGSRDQRR